MAIEVFEVRNPSFSDINLEAQIEAGINDWCAVDESGREFFRQSKPAAVLACDAYNMKSIPAVI